jgi:hypothetical protein
VALTGLTAADGGSPFNNGLQGSILQNSISANKFWDKNFQSIKEYI